MVSDSYLLWRQMYDASIEGAAGAGKKWANNRFLTEDQQARRLLSLELLYSKLGTARRVCTAKPIVFNIRPAGHWCGIEGIMAEPV